MKKIKKDLICWIVLCIVIFICVFNTYFIIPRKKDDYLNYLSKYEQEIIIESKVEDVNSIDINTLDVVDEKINVRCFEAYNCSLKSNPDIKFIVGYGKFRRDHWEVYGTNIYVDNFYESILEYLRNKYFTTIEINDNFTREDAVDKIENIIEQWKIDAVNYGITPTAFTANLKFNILYYDKLIENVEIWNTNDVNGILLKNINSIRK